jgi:putative SOS response-associated peptidase YedK
MCGRTAQTYQAVTVAARALGVPETSLPKPPPPPPPRSAEAHAREGGAQSSLIETNDAASHRPNQTPRPQPQQQEQLRKSYEWHDNYNLSPGMDAYVFYKDNAGPSSSSSSSSSSSQLKCDLKRWGLIPRGGTPAAPIDTTRMASHFALHMFNARTDTLLEKPTFARLLKMGKTCVIAVDGFYEWKESRQLSNKNRKQPYFVHRHPYLLVAGLHTRVPTGAQGARDAQVLDTFTILTTEVSEPLQWLHTRMPVLLDDAAALLWLDEPHRNGGRRWTPQRHAEALGRIEHVARHGVHVQWHPVTPQMSSLKFRSSEATRPVKETKSIASFFASATCTSAAASGTPPKRRRGDDKVDDEGGRDDEDHDNDDRSQRAAAAASAAVVVVVSSQSRSVDERCAANAAASAVDDFSSGTADAAAADAAATTKQGVAATPSTTKRSLKEAPPKGSSNSKKPKTPALLLSSTSTSTPTPTKQKTIRSYFSPKSAPAGGSSSVHK